MFLFRFEIKSKTCKKKKNRVAERHNKTTYYLKHLFDLTVFPVFDGWVYMVNTMNR